MRFIVCSHLSTAIANAPQVRIMRNDKRFAFKNEINICTIIMSSFLGYTFGQGENLFR